MHRSVLAGNQAQPKTSPSTRIAVTPELGAPPTTQMRTAPSAPAVAAVVSQVPSGAIATAFTGPSWPVRVARGVPSAAQVRTVPSWLPVASQVPSGAIATRAPSRGGR